MIMKRVTKTMAALAVLMFVSSGPLKADVIVNVTESGADVVWSSAGGAFDLTGLTFGGPNFATGLGVGFTHAADPTWMVGTGNPVDFWRGISGPGNYGPGLLTINSGSATGLGYGISDLIYGTGIDSLLVPSGYVSGGAIGAATSTYTGHSFASLGLTPGTYVWTWGRGGMDQSITLNIVRAVPEPSMAGLLGLSLLGLGLIRRRKLTK